MIKACEIILDEIQLNWIFINFVVECTHVEDLEL